MPNGGFGCAYCIFLRGDRCELRGALISNDHYTVCPNVTYPDGAPVLGPRTWSHPLPKVFPEKQGSIHAITTSEGAYIQVPWLENSEIREDTGVNGTCYQCQVDVAANKRIRWGSEDFDFCSFNHYLEWRNSLIEKGEADDTIYSLDLYLPKSSIAKLEIVNSVSTERSRRAQNVRSSIRTSVNRVLIVLIGGIVILTVWALFR